MKALALVGLSVLFAMLALLGAGCGGSASVSDDGMRETSLAPESEPAAMERPESNKDAAQDEKAPGQDKCPVMGREVNREIYTDYKGIRIYFCCPPCIRAFESDPEKYVEKLKAQGTELEKIPAGK